MGYPSKVRWPTLTRFDINHHDTSIVGADDQITRLFSKGNFVISIDHCLPPPTQGLWRIPWRESEWKVIILNMIFFSIDNHPQHDHLLHQCHLVNIISPSSTTCAEVIVAVRLVALTDQATWMSVFYLYTRSLLAFCFWDGMYYGYCWTQPSLYHAMILLYC